MEGVETYASSWLLGFPKDHNHIRRRIAASFGE